MVYQQLHGKGSNRIVKVLFGKNFMKRLFF